MFKTAIIVLALCALGGCASTPPPGGYSICATQPGSYQCQIERYQLAN